MEFKLDYREPVPNKKVNLLVGPTREGHRSKRRSTKLPASLADYYGENLVFVVGPPRSGTTWVLKLLSEHPCVVAATADNLGLPSRGASTESGIFTTNLNSQEIKTRFLRLSRKHKNKVIVEKTPVHLFYVPQILKMFPEAAIVMTRRGGRDTVASILAVGRKTGSWWKDAPWKAPVACELWKGYAIASSRCEGMCHPYVIRYEDLHNDPSVEFSNLLTVLDLDTSYVGECIDRSRDGKNIKTEGVFRKGKVGGWREVMTDEDVLAFEDIAEPHDWHPQLNTPIVPDVTVILSSFERPAGLLKSFRSLLKQTLTVNQMEIIICDDGSEKKEVKDKLFRLGNNYNVTVIKALSTPVGHKEKFCTFTQLLNRALAHARGRYITYLTDGDVYEPDRCRRYVAALDQAPHVDMVWGRTVIIFGQKREESASYQAVLKINVREHLPLGNFIDHNTFMHRRSYVRWSTSPDSWRFADWLFLQRMLLDGAIFMPLKYVGQTLYITENSLGQAMGMQGKSLSSVITKRRTGK